MSSKRQAQEKLALMIYDLREKLNWFWHGEMGYDHIFSTEDCEGLNIYVNTGYLSAHNINDFDINFLDEYGFEDPDKLGQKMFQFLNEKFKEQIEKKRREEELANKRWSEKWEQQEIERKKKLAAITFEDINNVIMRLLSQFEKVEFKENIQETKTTQLV